MPASEWFASRSSSVLQASQRQLCRNFIGADGGTRTRTGFPPRDFKSLASTISPRPRMRTTHNVRGCGQLYDVREGGQLYKVRESDQPRSRYLHDIFAQAA